MQRFALVFLLALSACTLFAAGTLELTCFKDSGKNGQGWILKLPQPVTADSAEFSCEAVIEPVPRLRDQGLRAMLRLSANPDGTARPGDLLAGVEFFKGISTHAVFGETKSDNWARYSADTPVRVRVSWSGAEKTIRITFQAAGQPERKVTIPTGKTPVDWNYFSLVSWRNGGNEPLVDKCAIHEFKVNGQEIQGDEFEPTGKPSPTDSAGAKAFREFLDKRVRPQLPAPGVPFYNTLDWRNFPCNSFSYARYEIVPTPEMPFPNSLRMTGLKRPAAFHTVQIAGRRNEQPIKKGDVLFMQFTARCLQSSDESGDGIIGMHLVADSSTWSSVGGVTGTFNRDWKTFYGFAVAKSDFEAGKVRIHLFLSHLQQTVELGGIAVLNLGPDVDPARLPVNKLEYAGRPDDAWRRKAAANIEQYRKGDFEIELFDGSGKPVPGAEVKIAMTRHAFGFGCYADDAPLLAEGPEGDRFRAEFLRNYNRAIVPMFWGPGNAENKRYGWENPASRERYLTIAKWCHENGLTTQAHVLMWPSSMYAPPDVPALKSSPEKLQERLLGHIESVIKANGDNIDQYQVLNEPCGTMEYSDIVGIGGMAEWFKAARRLAPGKPLLINDNGILSRFREKQDRYEKLITDLLAAGAPIDTIGFQGHIGSALPGPEQLWQVFDRFAAFQLPIQITEFTVDIPDEALQAEYTRDFLTAAFSHPAVSAVTAWGMWAGKHYSPRCAYFRKDWSPKPNAEAWRKLVSDEWTTNVETKSDDAGRCRFRGFYGDYRLDITCEGKTVTRTVRLTPEQKSIRVTL